MRRLLMRSRLLAVAAGAFVAVAAAAACSLGLDESLIDQVDAGPLPDSNTPDAATDTGTDVFVPAVDASACTKDDECTTTHGCFKGKCDLSRKACVYDVCRPAACSAGVCDTMERKCGASAPYKFKAGQFTVGATTASALAAVYPYLFVLTPTGVLAFDVSNPTSTMGRAVPVTGLGFVPTQIVATGNRVYFVAAGTGPGPSRLPLAYVDVPADPFAPKLAVNTVLATYNRPAAEPLTVLPRGGDSLMLVGPLGSNYPTAFAQAPLVEPLTVNATAITFAPGAVPASVSGTRLVMSVLTPTGQPQFAFINNAGSASPANAGEVLVSDAGSFAGPNDFSSSAEGAVFWAAAQTNVPPPAATTIRAVRGFFLVADANGTTFDASAAIDLEVYAPSPLLPPALPLVGPTAMLDAKTAMVVAAAKENTNQTSITFVKRGPPLAVAQRAVVPVPFSTYVAAAGSNGFGYLVTNEASAVVHVYDPACAP